MCGFTKDSWKMYRYNLEERVCIVQAVTADILARTFQNMVRRVQSCLDANGCHFQHMLRCRHVSHTTNVLLFKFHCNIFIGVRIINPLKPKLNPICYLLALLGAHHFLHVIRIRVKLLTFRLLMSYIYMEHPFLMFLDHTQRRSTVGRTPLDE